MSDDLRRMLDRIVERFVVDDEVRSIDRDASLIPDGEVIEESKTEATRREIARHEHMAPAFQTGLVRAWERSQMGGKELVLDDRDADQDAIADALIQLLVRFDLATSRTESTDPMHYTYNIGVDWSALHEVAGSIGVDLEASLQQLAQRKTH